MVTQQEVDHARFWALVHAAVQYGLVTAPQVNADACEVIVEAGKKIGIEPAPDLELIERFLGVPDASR